MFDKGFFGGLFDFNGDGKLDDFEKAANFAAFMSIIEDEEKETSSDDDSESFDLDEDEAEDDEDFEDIEDDD